MATQQPPWGAAGYPPPQFFMAQMEAYQKMMEQMTKIAASSGGNSNMSAEKSGHATPARRSIDKSVQNTSPRLVQSTSPRPPPSTVRRSGATRLQQPHKHPLYQDTDDHSSRSRSPRPPRKQQRSTSPRPTPGSHATHASNQGKRRTPGRSISPHPTPRGDEASESGLLRSLNRLDGEIEKKGYGGKYLHKKQHFQRKKVGQRKAQTGQQNRPPRAARHEEYGEYEEPRHYRQRGPLRSKKDREMAEMDALEAAYRRGR